MFRIIRAIKAAQTEEQLEAALSVARDIGARGLEVQAVPAVMAAADLKARSALVARFCQKFGIDRLVYHMPFPFDQPGYESLRQFDFCADEAMSALGWRLTKETIDEAAFTAAELGFKTPVLINVHLLGIIKPIEATLEKYKEMILRGEQALINLSQYAAQTARRHKLAPGQIMIVRENNPPSHEGALGLLDFHPAELIRTAQKGIGVNLDFAHFKMCRRYWQSGRGEWPGADLVKDYAGTKITWAEAIKLVAPYLELLHLNDVDSYQKEREGLEVGQGAVPHQEIIPLICAQIPHDIVGTYEMRGGHKDPKAMARSDAQYRKWFEENFDNYFI